MNSVKEKLVHFLGERGVLTYRFCGHLLEDAKRGRFHVSSDFTRYWYQMHMRPAAETRVAQRPFHIGLYRNMLRQYIQDDKCVFLLACDAAARKVNPDKVNLVLRHDLDSLPEMVRWLCDAELECGLRSTIYVIMADRQFEGGADYGHACCLRRLQAFCA